jgi:ribulose bisphosphate carboxylase small subunit
LFEEKVEAVKVQVQRLLDTGFIKEVEYPQWLANMVTVRKKEWQMVNVYRFYKLEQVLSKR